MLRTTVSLISLIALGSDLNSLIYSGKVRIADALPFIVDVLHLSEYHPKKGKRNLRNAARGRIEYAYQRNTFGKAVHGLSSLNDEVDAKESLTWACAKRPELEEV